METVNNRQGHLEKLSGSNFEIADGQEDIRGWDVRDSNGREVGEVEDLIFDYDSQKVRYLVVDMDDNELDLEHRKVLIPIGIVEFNMDEEDVILPGVSSAQLAALPEYDDEHFDTEHESRVRNVFGGPAAVTGDSDRDGFYTHQHFDDSRLYRQRTNTDSELKEGLPGGPGLDDLPGTTRNNYLRTRDENQREF